MPTFSRVNRNATCRICGKPDYCGYTFVGDRTLWICMRNADGSIGMAANGGFKHWRDGGGGEAYREPLPERAPLNRRATVYREMLDQLSLDWEDSESLIARGFSEADLELLGYKTVRDVAERLAGSGLDLTRVPGFYKLDDEWRMMDIEGFFVPVRDRKKRILGLQVRRREGKPKYLWFSSAGPNMPLGAGSGAPVHRRTEFRSDAVWVTESPLKADYLAVKKRVASIGIAGVWAGHAGVLEALLEPGSNNAVIAFDGNWRTNPHVARALVNLTCLIRSEAHLTPSIAVWDGDAGVDDVLEAGQTIETIPLPEWFNLYGEELEDLTEGDPQFWKHRADILAAS